MTSAYHFEVHPAANAIADGNKRFVHPKYAYDPATHSYREADPQLLAEVTATNKAGELLVYRARFGSAIAATVVTPACMYVEGVQPEVRV
jgi:hypothetical protein|tara:strand:- start:21422 stop:21691 length:270 start_codon:yes stop_codon:yes gene_type:complete